MQRIGLAIGLLVLVTRLPGVIWPEAYVARVRSWVLANDLVVRILGVLLLAVGATIVVLIAKSITFFQTVMLVLGVGCLVGAAVTLAFPEPYRRFADGLMAAMPAVVVRLTTAIGVAVGVWIVYLSLTLA